MLQDGRIDAMFQAFMPTGYFEPDKFGLRPLVRDFKTHELDYYRDTGYVLALKEAVVRDNPWVSEELCRLLDASRKLWREKRRRYAETTPWVIKDLIDEGALLAPDYDVWGYDANERMVNDFCREAYEQGLTEHLNTADKLFPKEFRV